MRKHTSRGHLAGVLEDNRRRPMYWYQASGTYRRLEGAQIFIDPRRRTWAVTEGDKVVGMGRGEAARAKKHTAATLQRPIR